MLFIRVFSSGGSDDGPPLEMLAEKSVRGNDESESWWFIHSHTRTHRSTTDSITPSVAEDDAY